MKTEFNIGDIVTYKPYETGYQAKIAEVLTPKQAFVMNPEGDDRVFYKLTGSGKTRVNAITTGLCIKESMYFDEYTEEKRANFFKE